MTDHKPYIVNALSRALEGAAESRAKKTSPKVWKALQETAPHWPIYDASRIDSNILTAWDVAKRVAIDDIIHDFVKIAQRSDELSVVLNDAAASAKALKEANAGKSVADA